MDEYRSRRRNRQLERQPHPNSGEGIQFLLRVEEQILQSISAHAPLSEVLNRICSALDCQIGDVVSFISLPEDDAGRAATTAMNAALFGLYEFCSGRVVAENNELLGSLEMYSTVPRKPSASDFQIIERAICLAAIAIEIGNEANHQGNREMLETWPARKHVIEPPEFVN